MTRSLFLFLIFVLATACAPDPEVIYVEIPADLPEIVVEVPEVETPDVYVDVVVGDNNYEDEDTAVIEEPLCEPPLVHGGGTNTWEAYSFPGISFDPDRRSFTNTNTMFSVDGDIFSKSGHACDEGFLVNGGYGTLLNVPDGLDVLPPSIVMIVGDFETRSDCFPVYITPQDPEDPIETYYSCNVTFPEPVFVGPSSIDYFSIGFENVQPLPGDTVLELVTCFNWTDVGTGESMDSSGYPTEFCDLATISVHAPNN